MRVGILGDPYYRYNDFEYLVYYTLYTLGLNGLVEIDGLIRVTLQSIILWNRKRLGFIVMVLIQLHLFCKCCILT